MGNSRASLVLSPLCERISVATRAEKILAPSSGHLQTTEALQLSHLPAALEPFASTSLLYRACDPSREQWKMFVHSLRLTQCRPPASGSREQHKGVGTIVLYHIASDLIATGESFDTIRKAAKSDRVISVASALGTRAEVWVRLMRARTLRQANTCG